MLTKLTEKLIGKEDPTMKAIIIYPSRKVSVEKIPTNSDTFNIEENKTCYKVVPEAIYYFKGWSVLFYVHGVPAPIVFSEQEGIKTQYSAQEFHAIMNNKVVQELLDASKEEVPLSKYLKWVLLAGFVGVLWFLSQQGII